MYKLPDLTNDQLVALDLETYDPRLKELGPGGVRGDGYMIGFSVATPTQTAWVPVDTGDGLKGIPVGVVRQWFADTFRSGNKTVVGANFLYDLEWLRAYGIEVNAEYRDVQYAEALLDENKRRYNLESLARKYLSKNELGEYDRAVREAYDKGFAQGDPRGYLWEVPYADKAIVDTKATLKVYEAQEPLLEAEDLTNLYELECGLVPLLLQMRMKGVRVDVEAMSRLEEHLIAQNKHASGELNKLAGFCVSPGSSKDLDELFRKRGLVAGRTDADGLSFDKSVLTEQDDPACDLVLQLRQNTKLLSTFVYGLYDHMHLDRVHCCFHPLKQDGYGTVSGRFSGSHPNLQNQPSRGENAKYIRSLFLPEEDCVWMKRDYSQVEYRLLVHYAAIQRYTGAADAKEAYISDRATDFHQWVAKMVGLPRKTAKNINFGLVYGMGVNTFAKNAGISVEAASKHFQAYHGHVPFVRLLSDAVANVAGRRGYIKTLLNRRRRFPRNNDGSENDYTYKALNALIQGTAADVIKKAMHDCYKAGVFNVLTPHLTVHDELDVSVPDTKEGGEASDTMLHIMENCIPLEVPLLVDTETGPNWWDVN